MGERRIELKYQCGHARLVTVDKYALAQKVADLKARAAVRVCDACAAAAVQKRADAAAHPRDVRAILKGLAVLEDERKKHPPY